MQNCTIRPLTLFQVSLKKKNFISSNIFVIYLFFLSLIFYVIYTIYKENNSFQLFWADLFSFNKCPEFSIQITQVPACRLQEEPCDSNSLSFLKAQEEID